MHMHTIYTCTLGNPLCSWSACYQHDEYVMGKLRNTISMSRAILKFALTVCSAGN